MLLVSRLSLIGLLAINDDDDDDDDDDGDDSGDATNDINRVGQRPSQICQASTVDNKKTNSVAGSRFIRAIVIAVVVEVSL